MHVIEIKTSGIKTTGYALSTTVSKSEMARSYANFIFLVNVFSPNLTYSSADRMKNPAGEISVFIKSKVFPKVGGKK